MARLRELAPSRATLACLGVCGLIVLVAAIDYDHAESELPDVSPRGCDPANLECFNEGRREQIARNRAAEPMEDQYNSRAWLYAFAILTVCALAVANSLRTRPRGEWLGVFTNLGVIGVWVGIASTALLLIAGDASITIRAGPALTIPVALLGAAAVGTIVGRTEGWGEGSPGMEQLAGWLSTTALLLTAVTVVLAVAFIVPQPECGGGASPPGWTNPIDSVAAVTGIGAIAAGIAALALRRWIAALVSVVVNPVALLLIVASTCAFY